jgi:hypothetical protein
MKFANLPKVSAGKNEGNSLTQEQKREALKSRDEALLKGHMLAWPLGNIKPMDLAWVLEVWLPDNFIALPDGQSRSSDWYIKLPGHIAGIANKLYSSSSKTALSMNDVEKELLKTPAIMRNALSADSESSLLQSFTLVVYSSNLAPELNAKTDKMAAYTFQRRLGDSGMGLVHVAIVNPKHEDGLASLLSQPIVNDIDHFYAQQSEVAALKKGNNDKNQ